MTRRDALIALENAVVAGDPIGYLSRPYELHTDLCWKACNGSLDAAKALHDALLPGWFPGLSQNTITKNWCAWVQTDKRAHISVFGRDPARAWLIAILRALISEAE